MWSTRARDTLSVAVAGLDHLGLSPARRGLGGGGGHEVALAIDADAFDAWKTRLGSLGIAIEAINTWDRGGRSLYFRDPDGHSVELATPGLWENY